MTPNHRPRGAAAPPTPAATLSAEPAIPGRCYRCGNPTSGPEVGLCDTCNPSGIAGPTATQVHGLILACVAGALILMAVAAKVLGAPGGPYTASVVGQALYADGTAGVVVSIANEGTSVGRPTCTIVRGPDDAGTQFLAEPIEPGATVVVSQHVSALAGAAAGGPVTVECQ